MYIIIYHSNNSVDKIFDIHQKENLKINYPNSIIDTLGDLADRYPKNVLIWCHLKYEEYLNLDELNSIFHHDCMMVSFSKRSLNYLTPNIGLIDSSIFVNPNRTDRYPTWLMHSDVGGINSQVLNLVKDEFSVEFGFDYWLNCLAKLCMPQGLFCYSDPKLLKEGAPSMSESINISNVLLFKFVRENYKSVWVYLLIFSMIFKNGQFPIFSFLQSLFKGQNHKQFDFSTIEVKSSKNSFSDKNVDVIIPTIGRKPFLFDVLKDLSKQSILPKKVIIVEQNPDIESVSELDYLSNEIWPFKIVHHFIHKIGVCNARNLALSEVTSEWVLLGDDDNRFEYDLIENFFNSAFKYGIEAVSSVYLQPNEIQKFTKTHQTSIFGSGNSLIKRSLLKRIKFDNSFEFGYGEDRDFGMQIRYAGGDILFDSNIKITHLKASSGGFRTNVVQKWDNEPIPPKPSPTISLFNLKYFTKEQLYGYKLLLFFKYFKYQKNKNPYSYFKYFNQQWEVSIKWAKYLLNA